MRDGLKGFRRLGIREATQVFGLTARAIRYYEQRGLVTASRDTVNQRYFDSEGCLRLSWISKLRRAGLPLEEVEGVLDAFECGDDAAGEAILRLSSRRRELEETLKLLHEVMATVVNKEPLGEPLTSDVSAAEERVHPRIGRAPG